MICNGILNNNLEQHYALHSSKGSSEAGGNTNGAHGFGWFQSEIWMKIVLCHDLETHSSNKSSMIRGVKTFCPIIRKTPIATNARNRVITQKRYQTSHDPALADPNVESIGGEKRKFEHEVKKTLQGKGTTIPEAPGWNEKIASNSEAAVKADRAPKKDFKELQQETVDRIHNKKFEKHPPESMPAADAWGRIEKKRHKTSDVDF